MNIDMRNGRLILTRNDTIALRDAPGTELTAHTGVFWLTREGSSKDHVLGPGETIAIVGSGLTVVSALRDGEIIVHEAAASAPAVPCVQRETLLQRWSCRIARLLTASPGRFSPVAAGINAGQ